MNHFALGRIALTVGLGWTLVASSLAQAPPSAPVDPPPQTTLPGTAAGIVVLPESVPDPLEPLNRVVYGFNKALMTDAVKPTAKVYRLIVVKPVRTGIGNFGKNIDRKSTRLNSSHLG